MKRVFDSRGHAHQLVALGNGGGGGFKAGRSVRGADVAHEEYDGEGEPQERDADFHTEVHAAAKRLARQAFESKGLSLDPERAQVELLRDVLGALREIHGTLEEVAEIVENGLADAGHEGVMDDVNATLPQRDSASAPPPWRALPGEGIGSGFDPAAGVESVLTAREIASLLRIDRKTVTRWQAEGEMPAPIAIKGVKRWRRSVIFDWLREREADQ